MDTSFDLLPCLYFSTTDEGIITEVNEGLCSHLRYRREELLGQKAEKIFTVATRIFHQTHFYPLLKMQGHVEEIYLSLLAKDGSQVPVLLNAARQLVDTVPAISHVALHVANRKKFEDELVAARKAAEKALNENTFLQQARAELQNNMEELDRQVYLVKSQNEELKQFNRIVTHDLQEPLRKMSLFSQMLKDQPIEPVRIKNIPERLMAVAHQMRAVLSGLQQYVWLTENPVQPEHIQLDQLVDEIRPYLIKDFPGVEMEIEYDGKLPAITADRQQMELVFRELLSNALRFRKENNNAAVRIKVYNVLQNQFRNLEGKYKYSDFWKIEVSDDGKGFDMKYSGQVFGLFKRLHAESGRGIGLALCKKVLENHQGSISISSQPDSGTTVVLMLPALSAPDRL